MATAAMEHRTRFPELADPAWLAAQYVDRGLSTHEIAAELGCSHMTVQRALSQLRTQLSRPRGRRPGAS